MNKALIEYMVRENADIMKKYFELQRELLTQIAASSSKNDLADLLDKLNDNNEFLYINGIK